MSKQGTVTINGQQYDAVTGLPLSASEPTPESIPVNTQPTSPTPSATHLHASVQRSTTLHRKIAKKPNSVRTTITTHHAPAKRTTEAVLNPQVRKFAPHPVAVTKKVMDIGPIAHPHVAKAHAISAAKAERRNHTPQQVSAAVIKSDAVTKAIANTHKNTKPVKTRFWQQRQRVVGVLTATLALVLLGGYFTYLNMPSLSVRVAAAQAGIDAAYPDYRPDGYSLNGPVTYSDGRVSMNFKANGSSAGFAVNQSKSGWDSDAVLDNYVTPRAGSDYMPYTERGLKIYTYNNSAAWVNGGILYTIEGNAPLSSEQIRRIATSLL